MSGQPYAATTEGARSRLRFTTVVLRRTRDGHILLHAIRADRGENRAYRVDQIQSVDVTNHPFTPRYLIEFPASGIIPASPTQRRGVTRSLNMRRS